MYRTDFKDFQICRHTYHVQQSYLRGLEELIGPHKVCLRTWRWVFLRVFEVERKRVERRMRRVVLLSNGWTPPKTNVPCHPRVFISVLTGLVLSFSVEPRILLSPPVRSLPGSRKDTPAFMPHYHRFETRHGGPMSFFIALLLAARFAEPARRRASQKLRRDSTKSPPTVSL